MLVNQTKITMKIVKIASLVLLSLVFSASQVSAQVQLDQTMTPTELVQEVLLGTGVVVSNVTFNGAPGNTVNNQIARYIGSSNFIDFDDGIVMVSGPADQVIGLFGDAPNPNITGDPDLYDLANAGGTSFSVNNCAVLEFDFVPTGDSLMVKYVFTSQEYPSYTCSSFNDPFGFFLSGPGITGPFSNNSINIATIPGTNTPIAVNTVNSGIPSGFNTPDNCLLANPNFVADSQYFVSNSPSLPDDVQFPGMTVTLTAFANVICGQEYHIKLAIADASDGALDSGVFLEAASFQSNLYIDAELDVIVGQNDSTVYEGCGLANLTFTRPGDPTLEEVVYLEVSGSATNGVDYTFLPDSIIFPPGVESITISIQAPEDNFAEGPEQVIIDLTNIASFCGGQELTSSFNFWISEADPFEVTFEDLAATDCGQEFTIAPVPTGGYGQYTYEWDTGDTTPSITVMPEVTTTYSVIVGDTCGLESISGTITITVPVYPGVTVDAGDDIDINSCLELADLSATIAGGNGVYTYEWYNGNQLIGDTQSMQYAPPGTTVITFVGTDACGNSATDELTINVPPVPISVDAGPDQILAHCFDSVMVAATITGGVPGEFTYSWYSAGSGGLSTESSFWYGTQQEGYLVVEVLDICNNWAIDSAFVSIAPLDVVAFAGPNVTVTSCHETVDLTGTASGGYEPYVVSWTQDSLIWGTNYELNHHPAGQTILTFTATDQCGNTNSSNVIIFYELPEMSLEISDDQILCAGETTQIEAFVEGGVGPFTYNWSSSTLNNAQITVQPFATTQYSVQVTDDCGSVLQANTGILVSYVDAIFDVNYLDFYSIELTNRSTPGDYYWEFGDGASSTETSPVHEYLDLEDHTISLTVTDQYGCMATTNFDVVPYPDIFIPNTFTPNNDGLNDLFEVKGHNIESFEMSIMNRYGEVIFRTWSMDDKWNGADPTGDHYVQNEVYVYTLKALGKRGEPIEKTGTITVFR
jgi:gliding motility-associated-like protein